MRCREGVGGIKWLLTHCCHGVCVSAGEDLAGPTSLPSNDNCEESRHDVGRSVSIEINAMLVTDCSSMFIIIFIP